LSFTIGVECAANTSTNSISTGIYHKGHDNSEYKAVENCTSHWSDTGVTVTTTVDHFSYYVVALKDIEQTQLPFLTVTYIDPSKNNNINARIHNSTRGISSAEHLILPAAAETAVVCNLSSKTMHMSFVHTQADDQQAVCSGQSYDIQMLCANGRLGSVAVTPKTQALYATLPAYNEGSSFKTAHSIEGTIYVVHDSQNGILSQVKMLCNTVVNKGQLLIITERAVQAFAGQFVYDILGCRGDIHVNQLVYEFSNKNLHGIDYHDTSSDTAVYELGNKEDSVLVQHMNADRIKVQVCIIIIH
jgi:hypothetical protein